MSELTGKWWEDLLFGAFSGGATGAMLWGIPGCFVGISVGTILGVLRNNRRGLSRRRRDARH